MTQNDIAAGDVDTVRVQPYHFPLVFNSAAFRKLLCNSGNFRRVLVVELIKRALFTFGKDRTGRSCTQQVV